MIANDNLPSVLYMFCVFYLSLLETGLVKIEFVTLLSDKSYFVCLAFATWHFAKVDFVKIAFCYNYFIYLVFCKYFLLGVDFPETAVH